MYCMHSKTQLLNTPRVGEVMILLDMIKIMYKKLRNISKRGITIAMYNKVL